MVDTRLDHSILCPTLPVCFVTAVSVLCMSLLLVSVNNHNVLGIGNRVE